MQLDDALTQIAEIQERLARAGTFRGYRSVSVALSGALAFVGAAVQTRWLQRPHEQIESYVQLWGSIAVLSLLLAGVEMWLRLWRPLRKPLRMQLGSRPGQSPVQSSVQRNMSVTAIQQLLPCLMAGGMVTFAILNFRPASASLLPGLWMVIFGLGVFASRPILPKPIPWVGGYYMLAGMIAFSDRVDPLSPWVMGTVFGVGQGIVALLLFWKLERGHDSE